MIIPIESPDIRSVYLLEISGKRSDQELKINPLILRIKRKLFDAARAKAQTFERETVSHEKD